MFIKLQDFRQYHNSEEVHQPPTGILAWMTSRKMWDCSLSMSTYELDPGFHQPALKKAEWKVKTAASLDATESWGPRKQKARPERRKENVSQLLSCYLPPESTTLFSRGRVVFDPSHGAIMSPRRLQEEESHSLSLSFRSPQPCSAVQDKTPNK